MAFLDQQLFDPGGFLPGYDFSGSTSGAGIMNTSEATPWWGGLITNVLQLTPNIISATQGHPYASTPYGQSSYGGGYAAPGGGVYGGGSFLGASGFGQISGTTLLLIGLGLVLLLRRR